MLHMRYAAIPKNSRSPNTGALLINYLCAPKGQEMLWKHRRHGSPPVSRLADQTGTRRPAPAKGKIIINSPEWLASFKDYAKTQKELEAILRDGGK